MARILASNAFGVCTVGLFLPLAVSSSRIHGGSDTLAHVRAFFSSDREIRLYIPFIGQLECSHDDHWPGTPAPFGTARAACNIICSNHGLGPHPYPCILSSYSAWSRLNACWNYKPRRRGVGRINHWQFLFIRQSVLCCGYQICCHDGDSRHRHRPCHTICLPIRTVGMDSRTTVPFYARFRICRCIPSSILVPQSYGLYVWSMVSHRLCLRPAPFVPKLQECKVFNWAPCFRTFISMGKLAIGD